MTHAPGPWTYDAETETILADGGSIARAEPASGPLMAAAPDLLEAAEAMLAAYVLPMTDKNARALATASARLAAAVAKARGAS